MNSFNEKEKKLLDTLEKLKNFEILTIKNSKEIKLLENKKNQINTSFFNNLFFSNLFIWIFFHFKQ